VFFLLAAMTYVEGASLHQDRAGATIFARYAFNELVSFVAGWVMVLDYVILLSVTAFTATHYLAAFWAPLGRGTLENVAALAILAWVAWRSIRGFARTRVQRIAALVVVDIVAAGRRRACSALIVFFDVDLITDTIHSAHAAWGDACFAVGVATVVFTASSRPPGLSGELRSGRRGLQRLIASATISCSSLRRRRGRRDVGAAGRRQRDLAGAQLPRGADGRRRRGLPPALVRRPAQVRDRGRGHGDADRRRGLGDARPVAAVLRAVDEPPDPERARAACTRGAARRTS
jgi:hypothetical protein